MTCPSCGASISAGGDRCPGCGTLLVPPSEGALAPDPLSASLRAGGKVEPLREIPGLKKKEKSWKDEVRERVRHRHRRRNTGDGGLPLFEGLEGKADVTTLEPPNAATASGPEPPPAAAESWSGVREEAAVLPQDDDLPLRPGDAPRTAGPAFGGSLDEQVAASIPRRGAEPVFDDNPREEWTLEGSAPPAESRPVERPAHVGERLRAAAIDLALLGGLWAVVVYFASRAAHVGVTGLIPAWPYLAAYLAFLGLVYAGYFSGTTGQTLGKIAIGLRVVDKAGQPPGYPRAFLRAVLGSVGIGVAFAGVVPMFFDPARRALHDRLSKTRVVKG